MQKCVEPVLAPTGRICDRSVGLGSREHVCSSVAQAWNSAEALAACPEDSWRAKLTAGPDMRDSAEQVHRERSELDFSLWLSSRFGTPHLFETSSSIFRAPRFSVSAYGHDQLHKGWDACQLLFVGIL